MRFSVSAVGYCVFPFCRPTPKLHRTAIFTVTDLLHLYSALLQLWAVPTVEQAIILKSHEHDNEHDIVTSLVYQNMQRLDMHK